MENNLTLLRPFDLKAVKKGDPVQYNSNSDQITYVAGPDSLNTIAYQIGGRLYTANIAAFKMAPLAWVEGKPVYKGDGLYYKGKATKILGKCEQYDCNLGVLLQEASHGTMWANCLTWEKPTTKHEAWINIYPEEKAVMCKHTTKQKALNARSLGCVATIRIEWEE